jgi:hypothetical protein
MEVGRGLKSDGKLKPRPLSKFCFCGLTTLRGVLKFVIWKSRSVDASTSLCLWLYR